MSDAQLRKFFNFDDSDLAANRAGRLTAKQSQAVTKSERLDSIISIGLGIVLLVVALIFTFQPILIFIAHGASLAKLSPDDTRGLAIAGLVWLLLGLAALGTFISAFRKLNRAVLKAEGKVSYTSEEKEVGVRDMQGGTSSGRTETQYHLHVGPVNFNDVGDKILNIIESGDTYTFYYVQGYGIVSGELVKKGK